MNYFQASWAANSFPRFPSDSEFFFILMRNKFFLSLGTFASSTQEMNDKKDLKRLQILAQKLYEKDPSKMGQWDAEMLPHQGASGGETSSDEGEPIPAHNLHQYGPQQMNHQEMENSRAYHMPMLMGDDQKSLTNSGRIVNTHYVVNSQQQQQQQQQRLDYGRTQDNHENIRVVEEESSTSSPHPYKCQICSFTVKTANELQVHCFVEHKGDSQNLINSQSHKNEQQLQQQQPRDNKDNFNKRINEEMSLVRGEEKFRRKSEDS